MSKCRSAAFSFVRTKGGGFDPTPFVLLPRPALLLLILLLVLGPLTPFGMFFLRKPLVIIGDGDVGTLFAGVGDEAARSCGTEVKCALGATRGFTGGVSTGGVALGL